MDHDKGARRRAKRERQKKNEQRGGTVAGQFQKMRVSRGYAKRKKPRR